jgi:hypothetical protein
VTAPSLREKKEERIISEEGIFCSLYLLDLWFIPVGRPGLSGNGEIDTDDLDP